VNGMVQRSRKFLGVWAYISFSTGNRSAQRSISVQFLPYGELSITCRSRCCPKCQSQARQRWVEALQCDLLNTNYFHVVFTVPHELSPLSLTSPTAFYDLLFAAGSQALLEVAADPQRMGAEIGFLSILHTWGSNLFLLPIPVLRLAYWRLRDAIHSQHPSLQPTRCSALALPQMRRPHLLEPFRRLRA
jgi:Transposase zinc-binding domain